MRQPLRCCAVLLALLLLACVVWPAPAEAAGLLTLESGQSPCVSAAPPFGAVIS